MKNSSDSFLNSTRTKRHGLDLPLIPRRKTRKSTLHTASLQIKPLGLPLFSKSTNSSCVLIYLEAYRTYNIGRDINLCDFIFSDRRVSRKHCQILFDPFNKKIFLWDGVALSFRQSSSSSGARVSLNGLFINGGRIGKGETVELCAGDEVSLACRNEGACFRGARIGFLVEKIIFLEEVLDGNVYECGEPLCYAAVRSNNCGFISKANILLSTCREILCSNDPLSCIRKCFISRNETGCDEHGGREGNKFIGFLPITDDKFPVIDARELGGNLDSTKHVSGGDFVDPRQNLEIRSREVTREVTDTNEDVRCRDNGNLAKQHGKDGVPSQNGVIVDGSSEILSLGCARKAVSGQCKNVVHDQNRRASVLPPGKKFYLNRLSFAGQDSPHHPDVVELSEIFYPVESLLRIFIATFTSDIPWFLSYCKIPAHLPVTIACHKAERCWSSSLDKRASVLYPDFPNLVVVYPQFPEAIAFGKDRKKSGIACHHPKLLVLQRDNSLRVVITSANLVEKQWLGVTNTVWWQDFPRANSSHYLSLFNQLSDKQVDQDSNCDFAAQLAGFIASLISDVPGQAHWILELAKYDFRGAVGHLVASVPGVHFYRSPCISEAKHFLGGNHCKPGHKNAKFIGSVGTSVAGLSHLFRTSADLNGTRIKKLAIILGKRNENEHGMLEVVLRRDTNIPADANAVSVLLPNPEVFSAGDCVQLGFLPKNVANWVAPLSDSGLFAFSAYIYPKEVLTTALEGGNNKVKLVLYVSLGPSFAEISELTGAGHVSALCSLVASIERCTGLWRLQEVLSQYKWPEHLETDFVFGASSIGSVNAQFLAAFSAAAGKRASQVSDSDESDPDWGCWSASQELRNPSIRIIFPTIERVKSSQYGILASKAILCFSQKTWQRLKPLGILYDSIPHPCDRIGLPMHVKVTSFP